MKQAVAAAANAVTGTRGSKRSMRRLPRWAPLAIALFLLAALSVAALRVDLIRSSYGLAQALEREKTLLEERRIALADVSALRDPDRLARLAEQRGFARPARIVDLPVSPPAAARVRP